MRQVIMHVVSLLAYPICSFSLCVQDSTVLQLLENNGILTLGMDSRDIDWQRTWRSQLDKDDRPGLDGTFPCPQHEMC